MRCTQSSFGCFLMLWPLYTAVQSRYDILITEILPDPIPSAGRFIHRIAKPKYDRMESAQLDIRRSRCRLRNTWL